MAIFEDVEDYEPPQVEEYEPPQVEAYEPPRRKKTAKKPTLPVEKRQVFTPKIPDQPFGKGSFRFETTPFQETPESYQLRSKETPTGGERLRREEMFAAKRGEKLKSVRQATPIEAKELESAQAEQDLYDTFGPAAYGVRKGAFNFVSGLAAPFTQGAEELVATPGDISALVTGGISELGKRQDARDRARNLQFDRNVIRKQESLFERGLPTLIEVGGNLLLNPRAPKQMGQGFRPPPDLGVGVREPLTLPPAPPRGSASTKPTQSYRPSPTPLDFYMVPSTGPAKAPVMIVPDWLIARLSGGRAEDTIGFNITTTQRDAIRNSIATSSARPEVKEYAWMQMEKLIDAADQAGVNSISILNEGYDQASLASSVFHETFHSGQNQAVKDTNRRLFGNKVAQDMPTAIEMLHDSQWARELPVIKTLIDNNPGLVEALGSTTGFEPHDILRAELPAYTMEGRGYLFFETSADAIDDLFDYFMHVADRNGIEALDVIQSTATIRPGMEDAIPLARSMYENWQRERAERLSGITSQSSGIRELGNAGSGLQGAPSRGVEPRSGEAGALTSSTEASRRSERDANLERFLEQSQVKVPVYHGTQSPTEITQIDPSKFDPNALYGPGFYTTQSSNIAAGEGGYTDSKKPFIDPEKIWDTPQYKQLFAEELDRQKKIPGYEYRDPDEIEGLAMENAWMKAREILQQGTPSGYKVYLDIRKPFDIDSTMTGSEANGIIRQWDQYGKFSSSTDLFKPEETVTGEQLYEELKGLALFDKADVNKFLESIGYDGITHLGGIGKDPKWFSSEAAAKAYADPLGAEVIPSTKLPFETTGPNGEQWAVKGHKVWIAFRPEQVKSATGNIGTFDPTNLQMSFAKANLGDIVKVKGYSAPAEVVGEGDEPGTMKVRFSDGTEDEFDVSDLKQKGKKMKDPMIAHLQQNPPTPPPEAGAEVFGPRSPLRVPVISTSYQEAIAKKFVDLLIEEKIDVDLTDPPSKQIYEALVSGDLREESVDEILKEEGVTWEQFIQEQMQSYSKAGRDLSILSRLDRNLERMLKQDPVKFGKYVAPQKQVEVILKVLNRSVLGRSLWSRYGGLIQKMVLTKLTTAMVNTRTTVARAIVDGMSEGLGAWMQNMVEGKGNFWERVKESKDEAVEAFTATLEVAKALNPNQLEAIINGKKGTAYQRHQEIITQLEKFFPDIHAKLFARPISGETQQRVDAEKYLLQAKSLLPRVKNASTRRDMQNQLKVLSKRMQFEKSLVGKTTLRGPEIAYDVMLIPMQFAEFLFRRPKFIGRLRLELMDRGIQLDEVLRQTKLTKEELEDIPLKERLQFKDIPEEAIKGALNNTLELTYAYDPSTDKEAPVMERAAGYFIKTMNALGPGAILGELFPRAIYNGMKTLYEYSPAPFATAIPETIFGSRGKSPIAKILRPAYDEDPKTKAKYRVNPPTRYDYERLAKAMIGSLLLFVAWDMIRQGEIGDEWWQLGDPTKKDEEGQSTYYDVRKDRPFSEYFHLASLAERYRRGTIGDKQLGNELLEIYTGIRRTDASPDFLDTVNAAGELFGANPESPGRKLAMLEAGGRTLAIPFTPILNLRDVWAIYSEEENKMKDTRGIWYGPIQDRFPYWRQSLPDLTSPIQPGPILISKDPDLLMAAGVQLTEGPNFAGREWQRLGLNYKNFLERDPDPSMNRAQNVYFEREIRRIGDIFEKLPYYMDSDDATKAALWEQVVTGDKGIAIQAQQFATLANPMEAEARKLQGRMPGKLQRKKYGLDKVLQGIRDLGEERQ